MRFLFLISIQTHCGLSDVLSEPDDSYPLREPRTKKGKNVDLPRGIGAFFGKPPTPTADTEEDILMNEGEATTADMGLNE